MITTLLLAAAAAVLLWPAAKQDSPYASSPVAYGPPPAPKPASYIEAVAALQLVRKRLVATDQLSEPQIDAVNVLTLALVSGGDK
jgi:hypothetical protein